MRLHEIFWCFLFFFNQTLCDPLLVAVLMVKNEAPVIVQTLQPLVDGEIKDFVIFDTGSTDETLRVVRDFFARNSQFNAHIEQEPFIDFATSRNHALDAVQKFFPHATFMLMLDAEWYAHNSAQFVQFCRDHQNDTCPSYLVALQSNELKFYSARLIRCGCGVKFVGVVHEVLNQVTKEKVLNGAYFEWRPSRTGQEKSALRWKRDRDLLLKNYEKNPYDARTLFYLAQTYECLGSVDFSS